MLDNVEGTMTNYLDFADEPGIFPETLWVKVGALDRLSRESEPHGLKVSWIENKIQRFIAFFDNLPPPVLCARRTFLLC